MEMDLEPSNWNVRLVVGLEGEVQCIGCRHLCLLLK